jgi:hypothetical protein
MQATTHPWASDRCRFVVMRLGAFVKTLSAGRLSSLSIILLTSSQMHSWINVLISSNLSSVLGWELDEDIVREFLEMPGTDATTILVQIISYQLNLNQMKGGSLKGW